MPPGITQNVSLATHTTLGVGGAADYYAPAHTRDELTELVAWARVEGHPITILGGGSNVLVADEGIRGLVIHMCIADIAYRRNGEEVHVTAGAGVALDALIAELAEKNLWGLENLSAIPGTVGAVPVQNVGAYGVEASDVIHSVCVYDITNDIVTTLTNSVCAFAYRDSIFKKEIGKKYIILSVTFIVSESGTPKIAYKDLKTFFETHDSAPVRVLDVRNAVIAIRSKKFPDWHIMGTAGSFFKNPIITQEAYNTLMVKYPEIPGFLTDGGMVKIALGWVLDHVCGMRGVWIGNVGLYEHQALVLVCTKNASAAEVKNFSQKIIDMVLEKTNIIVEREVTEV